MEILCTDVIKLRVREEGDVPVLRGSFRKLPTSDDLEAMVTCIVDYLRTSNKRVAIFLKSKVNENVHLGASHLCRLSTCLLQNKPIISERVLGTKIFLHQDMTTTFAIMLTLFEKMYKPMRPFLVTDSLKESQEFEATMQKLFIKDGVVSSTSSSCNNTAHPFG